MRIFCFQRHHHDSAVEQRLDHILSTLKTIGSTIMSKISDFAAKQTAHNDKVSADLDAIQAAIAAQNALILQLQNSAGTVTPEDQALIDQLEAGGAALETKADALANVQPPVVPVS